MNPYLIRLRTSNFKNTLPPTTDKTDDNGSKMGFVGFVGTKGWCDSKIDVLAALERRCPDFVPLDRWRRALIDGRRFLSQWGEQAEALGWTAIDVFGLHEPPAEPHPSYRRLSRYDCTGLVWLLDGRSVVALTAESATIRTLTGTLLTYRRRKNHG
jgi:hypothetical protein